MKLFRIHYIEFDAKCLPEIGLETLEKMQILHRIYTVYLFDFTYVRYP